MRAFFVASLSITLFASAAVAQDWKEYEYPQFGLAVSFPSEPLVDNLPYVVPDGTTANEMRYSVKEGSDMFTVGVVDLSEATIDPQSAIEHAVELWRDKGDVRLNIPARVNRHFGRQLSVAGQDGSHSTVAIFFADNRLYQISGTVLAGSGDPNSGDAIRFQQSLRFTGDMFGPRVAGGPGGRRRFRFGQGNGPPEGRPFRGGQGFRRNQAPAYQTPAPEAPQAPDRPGP